AWPHPLALHQRRFLATHFPKRTGFPDVELPPLPELPVADVAAYSLDHGGTAEIDDALSITPLEGERVRLGIHVAAPGLSVPRDPRGCCRPAAAAPQRAGRGRARAPVRGLPPGAHDPQAAAGRRPGARARGRPAPAGALALHRGRPRHRPAGGTPGAAANADR